MFTIAVGGGGVQHIHPVNPLGHVLLHPKLRGVSRGGWVRASRGWWGGLRVCGGVLACSQAGFNVHVSC